MESFLQVPPGITGGQTRATQESFQPFSCFSITINQYINSECLLHTALCQVLPGESDRRGHVAQKGGLPLAERIAEDPLREQI